MKKSLLEWAINYSRKKLTTHPEYEHYMHFSFIVQNNKILGCGKNHPKTPAKHYGYQNLSEDKTFKPKTHSEIDCYLKVKGILNKDKNFEIINLRLNKKGKLMFSKPCTCCHELLSALGCVRFYYSSEVGFLTIKV